MAQKRMSVAGALSAASPCDAAGAANAPPPVAEIVDTPAEVAQPEPVPQPAAVEPTANTDEFF